jgi:hypothetical protein
MSHYLTTYNDHTRHLSDNQLREVERRANEQDTQFAQKEGNGQGDWETFFSREVRRMRFEREA